MTLSETELILEELGARHPNLTKDLLTTLLIAAGWEEKTIQEATMLFSQRELKKNRTSIPLNDIQKSAEKKETPPNLENQILTKTIQEDITFYQPDGSEEGELHFSKDKEPVKKEVQKEVEKSIIAIVNETTVAEHTKDQLLESVVTPSENDSNNELLVSNEVEKKNTVLKFSGDDGLMLEKSKEVVSLVSHEEPQKRKSEEKVVDLPNNLPLLPFESSPHVWPFSKYKDVFHSDPIVRDSIQIITVMPRIEEIPIKKAPLVQEQEKKDAYNKKEDKEDREVVLKKVQLTRQDESLVFLAGVMLLAIILILGYMYSNGRL